MWQCIEQAIKTEIGENFTIEKKRLISTGETNLAYQLSDYQHNYFVKIKDKESMSEFIVQLRDFIKTEKVRVKEKFDKPEIVTVYISDGTNDNEVDLRGLGIGKQLYTYASQWMGVNNLKMYSQDLRTQDALNIWKSFKKDPSFNYSKNEGIESIVRKDGITIEENIRKILSDKINEKKTNTRQRTI